MEYIFSADSVSSNTCVEPLPRIKISFFLLSIFLDELNMLQILLHFY